MCSSDSFHVLTREPPLRRGGATGGGLGPVSAPRLRVPARARLHINTHHRFSPVCDVLGTDYLDSLVVSAEIRENDPPSPMTSGGPASLGLADRAVPVLC